MLGLLDAIFIVCVKAAASKFSFRGLLPLHHDGAKLDDHFPWYRPCPVTSSFLVFVQPAIVSIKEGQRRPMSMFDPQISGCVRTHVLWSGVRAWGLEKDQDHRP